MGELGQLLRKSGLPAQVIGDAPLFDVLFTGSEVRDYRGVLTGDAELLRKFNGLLRERGVLKGETKYYVSLAHTAEDVKHTSDAWADALDELAAGRKAGR